MAHPDEVVKPVEQVESKLISEAQQRHELAKGDLATPQEKKQAEVEQAHALSTRPDGSYAQLHETEDATLAVADKSYKSQLSKDTKDATKVIRGEVRAEDSKASAASK